MRVQRAYKTASDLTDRQVTACRQHAGAAGWSAAGGDSGALRLCLHRADVVAPEAGSPGAGTPTGASGRAR
jgi:hypothetical protein